MGGPGLYKDLGKKASKVLDDDYCFDIKGEVKAKASNGVKFEGAVKDNKKGVSGTLKTEWKACKWATIKETLDTEGKVVAEAAMNFNEYLDGLNVTAETTIAKKGGRKVKFDYVHEHFTANGTLDLAGNPKLSASVVGGYEGFSVGVDAEDLNPDKACGAVQYKGDNFQAAVICKDKGRDLKASYVQDVNSNLAIAAEFTCLRGEKSANLLTLGMSHKCDDDASCRAKINTEGIFSVVYCQRLKSDVTMKLSGQIDTQKLDNQAPRVGLVLTADL